MHDNMQSAHVVSTARYCGTVRLLQMGVGLFVEFQQTTTLLALSCLCQRSEHLVDTGAALGSSPHKQPALTETSYALIPLLQPTTQAKPTPVQQLSGVRYTEPIGKPKKRAIWEGQVQRDWRMVDPLLHDPHTEASQR